MRLKSSRGVGGVSRIPEVPLTIGNKGEQKVEGQLESITN